MLVLSGMAGNRIRLPQGRSRKPVRLVFGEVLCCLLVVVVMMMKTVDNEGGGLDRNHKFSFSISHILRSKAICVAHGDQYGDTDQILSEIR